MEPIVLDLASLSNIAVARFTVQPGAQFPWHSHPGPVIVTVTQGELVYVMADGCSENSYAAGTAFVDPGRGMVHSAYNPTDGETVIVATFTEVLPTARCRSPRGSPPPPTTAACRPLPPADRPAPNRWVFS